MFPALLVGGRVVVASPLGHMDAGYVCATVAEQRVTVLISVNSLAQLYLEHPSAERLAGMRTLCVGGE